MKDSETREKFLELRAKGKSYAQITRQIGVSKPTLIKWSQQYAEQLEHLRGEEMSALCERFRITREHRVERFTNLINRLEDQLISRDLTELKTYSLITLYINLMRAVRSEIEPARLEVSADLEVTSTMDRWEQIVTQVMGGPAAQIVEKLAGNLTESLPKLNQ